MTKVMNRATRIRDRRQRALDRLLSSDRYAPEEIKTLNERIASCPGVIRTKKHRGG